MRVGQGQPLYTKHSILSYLGCRLVVKSKYHIRHMRDSKFPGSELNHCYCQKKKKNEKHKQNFCSLSYLSFLRKKLVSGQVHEVLLKHLQCHLIRIAFVPSSRYFPFWQEPFDSCFSLILGAFPKSRLVWSTASIAGVPFHLN